MSFLIYGAVGGLAGMGLGAIARDQDCFDSSLQRRTAISNDGQSL